MPNQVYMCDWCKSSAENITDIQHAENCPQPKHQALMEDLASLHAEVNRLQAENEQLRAELAKWNIHGWWDSTS